MKCAPLRCIIMSVIIYFGVPGSGKTTLAAKIVSRNAKRGIRTYCNVDVFGSIPISRDDIGKISITNGDLILDEASIEFNNRAYKSLPPQIIQWFKLYRHYGIRNIHIFSQSYEDMDITLRRLATRLYLMRRSMVPGLFIGTLINFRIGIDHETHQIIDHYGFSLLKPIFVFGPRYYGLFDSWSAPKLPSVAQTYAGTPANAAMSARIIWPLIKSRMLLSRIIVWFKRKILKK